MTPLIGCRTGIATVVEGWFRNLSEIGDLEVVPYTLSGRNRDGAGVGAVALPLPAALATRLWRRFDRPRVDRVLGRPELVHGTNYVVPSSRAVRLISVYDLSFVHDPSAAADSVARFDEAVISAVERGAHVHTTSAVVAEEIAERYKTAAHVVMPGIDRVDLDRSVASQRRDGPPVIAAVGTCTRRKNFPLLVEAFEAVAARVAEVELVIAGSESDDTEAVKGAVARLDPEVRKRVTLAGRIDDTTGVYRRATVVAHPSRYEGFGLPVLEAMAHGVPVVAASGGSVPEVAGDAARLVPIDDADALAEALCHVLEDESEWSRLVEAGMYRVDGFGWTASAEAMADLYRRLCG